MASDSPTDATHRLHSRTTGHPGNPPLLLLHGITGSHRYWLQAEKALRNRFRLLIPDLLGFGESPKPDVDYRLPVFVESLRTFLEDQEVAHRPIAVVGHSLGTLVALEYMARYPNAFDRTVFLSIPRHTSREEAHRLFLANSVNYRRILGVNDFQACVQSARTVGAQVFLNYLTRFPFRVVKDSSKFTLRSLLTTLEHCLLDYRVDDVLEQIPEVPTLMIHGTEDMVAPLNHVEHLADRPGWDLMTIERTGHHVFLTHHRECLEAIVAFLQEYEQSCGAPVDMVEGAAS